MDHDQQEAVALHRWGVIAEAANSTADARRAGRGGAGDRLAGPPASRRDRTPLLAGHDRPVGRAWRAGGLDAPPPRRARRCRHGAGPPGAVRRGGRAALGAPVPLGRPDRLDPVSPPRDPGRGAHGAGPAATGRAAPRGARGRTEGVRPLRGRGAATTGGSPTCWSARGCPGHGSTHRCGPGCS